ncbi:MAG: CD1845 family protein [Ruminococcus sp.]|nr:CD1845 family protein [Ruminococcus sp.]
MRLIGKLLALPFMLVTGILYLVCKFLVVLSSAVLGILSGIIFLAALVLFFVTGFLPGLAWLMIAFLISPYGLPLAAAWLVGIIGGTNKCLKGFYIWLSRFGGAHRQPRSFSAIITSLIEIKLRR